MPSAPILCAAVLRAASGRSPSERAMAVGQDAFRNPALHGGWSLSTRKCWNCGRDADAGRQSS